MIQDESSDQMKKKGMLKKFYLNLREETVGTLQGDYKGTLPSILTHRELLGSRLVLISFL